MLIILCSYRAVFVPKPPRGLLVFWSKNSETRSQFLKGYLNSKFASYPRLTLDFHTNKRIIDEVVRDYLGSICFLDFIWKHRLLCHQNVYATKFPGSLPTWWNVSNADLSVVSPSNFKKRNVSVRITTFLRFLLSIRLLPDWSSIQTLWYVCKITKCLGFLCNQISIGSSCNTQLWHRPHRHNPYY